MTVNIYCNITEVKRDFFLHGALTIKYLSKKANHLNMLLPGMFTSSAASRPGMQTFLWRK